MRYLGVMTDEMPEQMLAQIQKMIDQSSGQASAVLMNVSPANAQTVTVLPTTKKEIFLNISPSVDLTTLNIVLPNNADAPLGQRCFIGSTKQIATCTITSAIQVNSGVLMFSPGDNAAFVRNNTSPQTWSRVLTS